MKSKKEIPFTFNEGIETQAPELVSAQMKLSNVENFRAVYARLRLLRAHSTYVTIPNESVKALAYSFNLYTKTLNFYALTDGNIYRLEINDGDPVFASVGSYNWVTDGIVSWAAWEEESVDAVYFTKLNTNITKISGGVASEIAATWDGGSGNTKLSARYCAAIDNRLFVANIQTEDGRYFSRRIQWSDLYNPEDFEVTRGKEADLFDLETGNLEITGIFSHRGYLTIFSRSSIWRAIYTGYPQVYRFEPVYSDFGNIYHGAAVTVKELIFFIGDDNFYVLDGFSPKPIGDEIWNYWKDQSVDTTENEILGVADPFNNEVMWRFTRKAQPDAVGVDYRTADHPWLLVYNFKEKRWSTRSADGMNCFYNNKYPLRGFQFIDQFHSGWDNDGKLTPPITIDDYPWRQLVFTSQSRTSNVVSVESVGHGLTTGDKITIIESVPTDLNGVDLEVTVSDVDNFTYSATGADGAASTLGSSDFRTIDGDWQFFDFPQQALVGREGEVAIYQESGFVDFLGNPLTQIVQSQELFFGTFMDSKELSEAKLIYKKVGDPSIKLLVGFRNNQNEEIEWTEEFDQQAITRDDELRFIIRKGIRSKFYSFKWVITNNTDNYVTEVNGGAVFLSGLRDKGVEV